MTATPASVPLRLTATTGGIPASVRAFAAEAESLGFDRLTLAEAAHDPFLQLVRAGDATTSLELATGVAIAFARTPMTLAYEAWGLHEASGGRAVIGLGSQVKAHIARRYGMPWDRPAARMREFVHAVRAIWDCWQTDGELSFEGEFYRHTLMTPNFAPPPLPYGPPPILLAGVGPLMAKAAGAVGDGFMSHPFATVEYLSEHVLPNVRAARVAAEADGAPWTSRPFEVVGSVLTALGRTEPELAEATARIRKRIAFYGSTPAYRGVLDLHGWGDLHEELHRLSRLGEWDTMAGLIDDEVFAALAVAGTPAEVGRELRARFAGVVDRLALSTEGASLGMLAEVMDAAGAAPTAGGESAA
jgi:probable F420-dependent oxidoreductase